ncbi:MAG: RsmD family RNA methyltransferase [Deinococcales bacterium]
MSRPRILGGSAKGRELDTPRRGTRPSPSRLREALFDILAFEEDGAFLDLYSGSGAIGLEAASRGWSATCVDLSREAARIIRGNASRAGLEVEVVQGDALRFAREHPGAFAVVFAAPPYDLALAPIFQAILEAGPARSGGLYVFQHPTREPPALTPPSDLEPAREKRYGSNALTLLRRRT